VRRVLFLAYYFPPHGGAGAQRTVKFLKHISAHGYEAVVIAGPEATTLSWAPRDWTLAADVPAGTEIRRVSGPEPTVRSGWGGRMERWLRLSTSFSRWWVEGVTALGLELDEVDLIYASMSPFETAEAAARLAAATGKPWVADLRDPWALDDWAMYPTAIHRRLEERRMGRLLRSADAVIFNTAEATRAALARLPELAAKRVETIPNGWDKEDFEGPPPARADGTFRIIYVGYAHVEAGRRHRRTRHLRRALGGATRGIDPLARSHVYLLEALDRLVAEQPELRSKIELHVAGAHPEGADVTVDVRVRYHGYLAHPQAVDLMRSADLLFLALHDVAPGIRARTVPGKTYEYLAARRPVLAALPDGDARDLVSRWPDADLCRPTNVDCLADAVRARLKAPRATAAEFPSILDTYERSELTRKLAAVFDALVVAERADPRERGV